MNKELKEKLFIYVLYLLLYLLTPIGIIDNGIAMFILLIILPIITFILSIIYGYRYSIKWFYPIVVGILFIPSIYIYYNESAWIYVFVYAVIAFIGEFLGFMMKRFVRS